MYLITMMNVFRDAEIDFYQRILIYRVRRSTMSFVYIGNFPPNL